MFNWGKRKKWLVMSTLLVGVVLVSLLGVQVVDRSDAIDRSVKIGIGDGKVITLGHVVYAAGSVDYTYDGVDDDVQFQAALDALPATGGRLVDISAVQKNFSATVTRAIPNVTVEGSGFGSYFTNDGVTALFTAGGNNWVFHNIRTDAGSINVGATTEWMWTNVTINVTYYAYRSPYGVSTVNDLTVASLTDSGLTSGRVPVAGAGGLLSDDADLTFATDTLTVTKIGAFEATGAIDFASQNMTNVDIDSGTIDGTTITAPTMSGTWLASGTVTLPAFKMSADINADGYSLVDLGHVQIRNNMKLQWKDSGGTIRDALVLSSDNNLYLNNDAAARIYFRTDNASGAGNLATRFYITGNADIADAVWSNTNHKFGAAYMQVTEMVAPGAGAADTARIYAVDDGGGLTDLCAVFQDGTVDIFAQETTPLDSPIFTYSSGTGLGYEIVKPHPGLIQFVVVFPNGETFVMREIEYHDAEKIAANMGCTSDVLPDGWLVTTSLERAENN